MSIKARAELERRKAVGTDAITKDSVGEYSNYDSKCPTYLPSGTMLTIQGLDATGDVLFGVNFPRLVELKKTYDPLNVFSKPSLVVAAQRVEAEGW
jgi:hypothetical protein